MRPNNADHKHPLIVSLNMLSAGWLSLCALSGEVGGVSVVLGAQWGDEGKGKLVDVLCSKADIVARCQGGNNAGHTVLAGGRKYDFHILPSGIIHPDCVSIIGSGCVVHIPSLFDELEKNGITNTPNWNHRLVLSGRAHIVFDLHQTIDEMHETQLNHNKIGTTKKGIGPAYSSKVWRSGIRVDDLVFGDFQDFANRLRALVSNYPSVQENINKEITKYKIYKERLTKLDIVHDTVPIFTTALQNGSNILVEGANGALLDVDFGTYPFVTSSNCCVGGACTGLGIPPTSIRKVIGVTKAYQTRVGQGPFPTEQLNDIGIQLQTIGKEVGVTTGRKRRCGWLDLVLLKYSHSINGFTALNLTKLDVLDDFDEIKMCIAYKLDGHITNDVPGCTTLWKGIEPIYETLPGWKSVTTKAKTFGHLPENARNYVLYIENAIGVHIKWIGVGPERTATIVR